MNFEFRVAYATLVGESLWLEIKMSAAKKVSCQILPMKWKDAQHWEIKIEAANVQLCEYRYIFKREDGLELAEFGEFREWHNAACDQHILFLDDWKSAGS